jgi:excisionase family DNA binding protein/PAS domain S-box-containing protein
MAPSTDRTNPEGAEGDPSPRHLAVVDPRPSRPATATARAPAARQQHPGGLRGDAAQALVSTEPLTLGRLLRVNPAFAALLGATPAGLRGRDLTDFLRRGDPDDSGRLAQVLDGQLTRADGLRQLITSAGDVVECEFTARTIGAPPGGHAAAVLSVIPLTATLREARHHAQAARDAVDAAPYGVAILDALGRCTRVNRAWIALGGSGPDAEKALLEAAHDPGAARAAVAAATSGSRQALTLHGARPDGTPVTVGMLLAPRSDATGVSLGCVVYARAVTDPESVASVDAAEHDDTVGPGVVARTLGVSHSTVRRWIEDGHLDASRTAGGHRRIRRSELRRIASTVRRPGQVRVTELPDRALPVVAVVLERHGGDVTRTAARMTYVPGSPGWFAEPAAARPLQAWTATAARALTGGRAPAAVAATRTLFEAARDVAGLEECLVFADRLSALILRRLQAEPGGPAETRDAQTILAAMRRSLLVLEDDRAPSR